MTPIEELDLLLTLIRKYNLPLSPILEYAVTEKKEENTAHAAIEEDGGKEDDTDEDDSEEGCDSDDKLSLNNSIIWFCQSALSCLEEQMDNRSYQILQATLKGESRLSIAAKHHLTQERIRQIIIETTKEARALLIEQHRQLVEIKTEKAKLSAQLNLLKEENAYLRALLPKDVSMRAEMVDANLDTELVELLETPIKDLALPVRAINILSYMDAKKFADIPMIESSAKVLKMRHSGRKTVHDITNMLEDFRLDFGMSFSQIIDALKESDWWSAKKKWVVDNVRQRKQKGPNSSYQVKENVTPEVKDTEDHVIARKTGEVVEPNIVTVKENRKGLPWTKEEEEQIATYFQAGKTPVEIAEIVGRSEIAIKLRLAKLELMEYTYGQEDSTVVDNNEVTVVTVVGDYRIENTATRCFIYNREGEEIFSADGKLKHIKSKMYRLNLKRECFTIKDMLFIEGRWIKGHKKIVADAQSELYDVVAGASNYAEIIEDIVDRPLYDDCEVKVNGVWYDYDGGEITIYSKRPDNITPNSQSVIDFIPKGKLKDIAQVAEVSYDFLWVMAIVEFMQLKPQPSTISFDRMACMEIAIAWELLSRNELARGKEDALVKCIEYLIEESEMEMDEPLDWVTNRKTIFNAIKDYPMAGAFEDMVDELLEKSPYNVLRAWFANESDNRVVELSSNFEKSCLYAIYQSCRDPYIEMNEGWKKYLFFEHERLMEHFQKGYLEFFHNS